ncbi:MAG: hypothetical protein AB7I27_13620 [Bacteriovoracaceae bacterium]
MKKFIFSVLLLTSLPSFAGMVWPSVYNFGNRVEVRIYNTSQDDVTCSGQVNMDTNKGKRDSRFYFRRISRGMFDFESYWLSSSDSQERYVSVNHSISCY